MVSRSTFGVLALAVLASAAMAQQQPRRPGGGGFGFGGPGGRGGGVMTLAGNEAVQKELAVGEAEVAKLKTLGEDYRKALQEEMTASGVNFQGLRDLPEAEREAKMAEFRTKSAEVSTKVRAKFDPKLAEVLSADQLKRIKEINLQNSGLAAYSDAEVVKALSLTDDQQKKIADIRAAAEKAQQAGFGGGGGGGDFQARMAKVREQNEKALADATAVLTDEQKTKFTSLKGKEFDVSQLRGGPGGPGGRPGGAGAPGGRPGGAPGARPGAAPNRPATE